MMAEACERLVAAGLPLWRVGVFVRTLHPDIFGRNFIWRPGAEVDFGTVDFGIQDSPEFSNSPLAIVFREGIEVRVRVGRSGSKRFPFIDGHARRGRHRLYRAAAAVYRRPGPRLELDHQAARRLHATTQLDWLAHSSSSPLARLIEIISLRRTAALLLDTYVGNRAGERILAGQIRRGHTETMHAAIWLSDLRGFTALSDRLPSETVVDILNRYFDCQVDAITDAAARC